MVTRLSFDIPECHFAECNSSRSAMVKLFGICPCIYCRRQSLVFSHLPACPSCLLAHLACWPILPVDPSCLLTFLACYPVLPVRGVGQSQAPSFRGIHDYARVIRHEKAGRPTGNRMSVGTVMPCVLNLFLILSSQRIRTHLSRALLTTPNIDFCPIPPCHQVRNPRSISLLTAEVVCHGFTRFPTKSERRHSHRVGHY
jgi:hypothetical protein